MLGRIIRVNENYINVNLEINIYDTENLMNKFVVFESLKKNIGEIISISDNVLEIMLIGEISNDKFYYGNVDKPSFNSKVRLITEEEIKILYNNGENSINIGKSYFGNYNVDLDLNNLFSNHFAILGNSGSGKSYAITEIIQQIFYSAKRLPFYPNLFIFDAYGEYNNSFKEIEKIMKI